MSADPGPDVRAKGLFTALELSCVPGPGCPEAFYLSLGFRHTGRVDENEIVLSLPLRQDGAGDVGTGAALAAVGPKRGD